MSGFGVYLHWPFCRAKCPYCDFNSHVSREVDQAAWRDALLAEIAHMRRLTGPRSTETMFFGGGTPSLMPPETVGAAIEAVDRAWGLAPGAEITLEANPTSVEAARFRGYAAAGVNRISVGVQALEDRDLKALGRQHDTAEALQAVDIARSTFERVSFDLIYARMGQTPEAWTAELDRALALGPDHLSLYQLTIEPETAFWALHQAGKLSVPRDEPAAEMYEITQERTEAAGLPSYEVSNHARPGAECRHNLIYWRGGLWAGIGPGAHGRIEIDGICHETETLRDPAGWLDSVAREGHGLARSEPSDGTARAEEYLMMAMRLSEGADLARFHALGGRLAPERLSWLAAEGFVETGADRLTASPRGRLVLNTVLSELLA